MLTPLHPAPAAMLEPLWQAMSTADRTELSVLSLGHPLESLHDTLAASTYSFCYLLDDQPVAIGGLTAAGAVWMVASTERLAGHRKSFLQASRAELALLQAQSPRLVALVDRRWKKSLRWLRWLGFAFKGELEYKGRTGICVELTT